MGKVNLPAAWIKVIDQAWPAMVLLALVKSSIYADDKWQSVHSISNSVKSPANTSIHNRCLSSIKYDDFLNSYSESAKWCVNLVTSWDINDGIFCVEHLNANPVVNITSFVCLFVWVITCDLQNQGLYLEDELCHVLLVPNETFVPSWWSDPQVGFKLRYYF